MKTNWIFPLANVGAVIPVCLIAVPAYGHGFIVSPPSRQQFCATDSAGFDCGSVKWEPHGVEARKGSMLCSGGSSFKILDSDNDWPTTAVGSSLTVTWAYSAPHRTTNWQYFLDGELIEEVDGLEQPASHNLSHQLSGLPSGRHTILAVWNIGDTANAFYSCVDVVVSGGGWQNKPNNNRPDNNNRPINNEPSNNWPTNNWPTNETSNSEDGEQDPSNDSCSAEDWVAGQQYAVGALVNYKGKVYKAEHANPGFDPVISHWFWSPVDSDSNSDCEVGTNISVESNHHRPNHNSNHNNANGNYPQGNDQGQQPEDSHASNNPHASCSVPNLVSGQKYAVGDLVKFEGKVYKAVRPNEGYNPLYSTWFWVPASAAESLCEASMNNNRAPSDNNPASNEMDDEQGQGQTTGTCAAPVWVAGRQYEVGALVTYNGKVYHATHANPGYDPVISTWFWSPASSQCEGTSSQAGNQNSQKHNNHRPDASGNFQLLISEATFNQIFPYRDPFYSYKELAAVANATAGFAKSGSLETRRREVAAFLANVAHETGNFQYIVEQNQANWDSYCDTGRWDYPCSPGKQYYGRGPIQLSWNYNYGAAGEALGIDLLNDPDLVARSSKIAWQTGLWFWMSQSGPGSYTPHEAIVSQDSFGHTIRAINGSVECDGRSPERVQSRIHNYHSILGSLGLDAGYGDDAC